MMIPPHPRGISFALGIGMLGMLRIYLRREIHANVSDCLVQTPNFVAVLKVCPVTKIVNVLQATRV